MATTTISNLSQQLSRIPDNDPNKANLVAQTAQLAANAQSLTNAISTAVQRFEFDITSPPFVDPTGANVGTGVFDQGSLLTDTPIGGIDITGGVIPPPVAPPPPVRRNNEPECDYRYSFGCPEFSRIPNEPGCRIVLPVYRTCFSPPNILAVRSGASLSYAPELMGYLDITASGSDVDETDTNFVQNGVVGTRRITGRRLTKESLISTIQGFGSFATAQTFLPKLVDRPDLGEGIISSVSTTPRPGSSNAVIREFSQFDMTAILNNLLSVTTSAAPGFRTPTGTINEIADDLARKCDLSKQPDFCLSNVTFTPRVVAPPPVTQSGPFVDRRNRVEIPGTRRPTDQTEKRQLQVVDPETTPRVKHPNKSCVLAIPVSYEDIQIWQVEYGFPVYANSDFSGNIINYIPAENGIELYPVSRGTFTEYINEIPDPNCGYREVVREYEEDDPSDRCFGIIKKDVTRIYEDGRQELVATGVFVRYYRKQDADCSPETVKIYHPLDLGRDVMTAKVRAKTKGLFDGSQTLECHHTSSTQPTASKTHYYEVTDCDSCGRTPYFAVAYGHNRGSGSVWSVGELNDTPTRAIYSQYRLLALDLPDTEFTFYTNGVATSSKDVYVINFSRTGMSDRIDPGNFEISLAELNGGDYANNVFTGSNVQVSASNKVLTFIDNSDDRSDTISCAHDPYVSYAIVSGSLNDGVYTSNSLHTYGIVYPNLGIMVLDPYKLNSELSFNTVTGSNIAGDNAFKLFTSISGSGVIGSYMKARNVKYKTTNHFFVRVASSLANYSSNPTYVSGSEGAFFHPCFEKNPQTYITSIGLYNDFNELLAVAKLSKPINKSFDNDVLVKIRLNW